MLGVFAVLTSVSDFYQSIILIFILNQKEPVGMTRAECKIVEMYEQNSKTIPLGYIARELLKPISEKVQR